MQRAAQASVAGQVALAVVELLGMVDVDRQQRKRCFLVLRLCEQGCATSMPDRPEAPREAL